MPTFKFGSTYGAQRMTGNALGSARQRRASTASLVTADLNTGESYHQSNRYNPVFDRLEQGSVWEDWVPRDAAGINLMLRRIHHRCPIVGPGIDTYSSMPWSDYYTGGVKDPVIRRFYEEAFSMFNPDALTLISREFLIIGRFCASLLYNPSKGYFDQYEAHDPDFLEIVPLPLRFTNPLIDLRISPAMRFFMQSQDERVRRIRALMPPQFLDKFKQSTGKIPLDQFSTLFMARSVVPHDKIGTSMLSRVVGLWALEKAMMDTTVTAIRRRSGAILHVTAGIDGEWEPAESELDALSNLFIQADEDPVGAVVVTRTGVSPNEVRQSGQITKISDEWSFFSEAKMRALGMSEALLDGSATFSNMESARSLLIEQVLMFRQQITRMVFGWISEQLARAHGFVNDPKRANNNGQIRINNTPDLRHNLEMESALAVLQQRASGSPYGYTRAAVGDLRSRLRSTPLSMEQSLKIPREQLVLPTIHWRKEMKPTQDAAYIELLEKMEEKGLPVPKRIWASAGGYDVDAAIEMMDEDHKLTQKIEKATQAAPGEAKPEASEPATKIPPGEGLKELDKLMAPKEAPEAPESKPAPTPTEVAPEKPTVTQKPPANPVKSPTPPAAVKPKQNPMASSVSKFPFFTDEKFLGLRRSTAMMLAQTVDQHLMDCLADPRATHEIVRSCVTKTQHRPIGLYLCARAGIPIGEFPEQYVEPIARALCDANLTPKQLTAELVCLAQASNPQRGTITPTKQKHLEQLGEAKLNGTALQHMVQTERQLPVTSPNLLGGVG